MFTQASASVHCCQPRRIAKHNVEVFLGIQNWASIQIYFSQICMASGVQQYSVLAVSTDTDTIPCHMQVSQSHGSSRLAGKQSQAITHFSAAPISLEIIYGNTSLFCLGKVGQQRQKTSCSCVPQPGVTPRLGIYRRIR